MDISGVQSIIKMKSGDWAGLAHALPVKSHSSLSQPVREGVTEVNPEEKKKASLEYFRH